MEYLLAQRGKPSNVAIRAERIKAREARKTQQAANKAISPETAAGSERPITLDDLLAEKTLNIDPGDEQSDEPVRPDNNQPEESQKPEPQDEEPIDDYDFGYVAEMFEEDALRWMTSRLNQAQEAGVGHKRRFPARQFLIELPFSPGSCGISSVPGHVFYLSQCCASSTYSKMC